MPFRQNYPSQGMIPAAEHAGWGRSVGIVWQAMNSLWWRVATSFLAGSFLCPPANAQSFFETLFGFGAQKPKAERAAPKTGVRMGTKAQPYSVWRAERFQSTAPDGDGYRRDPAYGGSYKTVCVRTCDGYYWPVSRSVTSERFATDAQRCDATCAGEAKLYTQHKDSDDPKSLVALDGTPYTALKTAFLYRKTLISGCGCKPAPWSVVETYRHREYKIADDAKKLQLAMTREREKAEALRRDKIAQIIAATREAVRMDEAEETTFGDSVAAIEIATDPAVSVTGYVHLHVLPDMVVDTELAESDSADPKTDVADLEAAFAEIAAAAPGRTVTKPRKVRTKTRKQKPAQSVQTVSLFSGLSIFSWPGEAQKKPR